MIRAEFLAVVFASSLIACNHGSVKVNKMAACSPEGLEETRTRYAAAEVGPTSLCEFEVQARVCTGGVWSEWSGTYTEESCAVTGGARDCGEVAHLEQESRLCYTSSAVPPGETCASATQSRTCNNGVWYPDYPSCENLSCAVGDELSCGVIPHGGEQTRRCYHTPVQPEGGSCAFSEQSRTCDNGEWAPDYQSCENLSCLLADNSQSPLGINLTGVIDWSSELVFVNYVKRAREWISQREGAGWGEGGPLDLDEHGWVRSLPTGNFAELIVGTYPYYEGGTYYVFFEGEGRLEGSLAFSGTVTASGQTLIANPANDYAIVSLVSTNPSDHLRNLVVVHEDSLADYQAGEIFRADFLETWKYYRTLRFMDWGSTNNSTIATWSDRPRVADYSYGIKGVPLEVMVSLANQLNAEPWFCIPHLADDDYVRQAARLVRDTLNPDLRIYLEYSNEVWNSIFDQFDYALTQSASLRVGGDSEFDGLIKYVALRSALIAQSWGEELGDTERLVRVYAVGGPSEYMTSLGMDYLATQNLAQHIDVIAIAPYVGSDISYSTVDEAIAGLTDPALMQAYQAYVEEVYDAADSYGLRLIAYEGGQHLWNFGDEFSDIGAEAQGDPRMYGFVTEYMRRWREGGGHEFMVFASGSGFWGQTRWGLPPMEAPKYQGHYDFLIDNPRWW